MCKIIHTFPQGGKKDAIIIQYRNRRKQEQWWERGKTEQCYPLSGRIVQCHYVLPCYAFTAVAIVEHFSIYDRHLFFILDYFSPLGHIYFPIAFMKENSNTLWIYGKRIPDGSRPMCLNQVCQWIKWGAGHLMHVCSCDGCPPQWTHCWIYLLYVSVQSNSTILSGLCYNLVQAMWTQK